MVKIQFSFSIKTFCTDNAVEYIDPIISHFLSQNGTIVQGSCPGTPQQNDRAEWKHRHILETVSALLISSSCPECLWGKLPLL